MPEASADTNGVPEDVAAALEDFATRLGVAVDLVGLYVAGSVASGDYRHGVSDVDLIAVTRVRLDMAQAEQVSAIHRAIALAHPTVVNVGCQYLPLAEIDDVAAEHPTWSHGELFDRRVSGVARGELHAHGLVLAGAPIAEVVPPVSERGLRDAALAELSGYWSGTLRKRRVWVNDVYVDLSLITIARVEATVSDGTMITKAEAIRRLPGLGVPPRLVDEIRRRRAGEALPAGWPYRLRRAVAVRRIVGRHIRRLLGA